MSAATAVKMYEPKTWKSTRWWKDRRWWFVAGVVLYLLGSVSYAYDPSGSIRQSWENWLDFLCKMPFVVATIGMGIVSLLSTSWLAILVINGGAAALWFLPEPEGPWRWSRRFLHQVNRQLGHVDTALYSSLAALALLHRLPEVAAPLAPALLLGFCCFGVVVVDQATIILQKHGRWCWGGPKDGHLWARRPLFYAVTMVSMLVFLATASAPSLRRQILWLGFAVGISTGLRFYRWLRVARAHKKEGTESKSLGHTTVRPVQRLWLDQVVPWWVMIPLLWPVAGTYTGDEWDKDRRSQAAADCAWQGEGPRGPADVSLFLVADTQFHELGGNRTGVHVDLVDSLVPVAVRPVVLDLLSGVTLAHFADIYNQMPAGNKRWAHLGDVADLSCKSELERFIKKPGYLDRFGPGLVALLPGNHDSTFIGNFAWHPEWGRACGSSQLLPKVASDQMIFEAVAKRPEQLAAGQTRVSFIEHGIWSLRGAPGSALPWVSRLGYARGREVVGVFLDTSDYTSFVLGLAGAEGSVSSEQIAWVEQQLALHPQALVILFLHHPFAQLAVLAKQRVTTLATGLGRRLLALVSAHTHLAALRTQHVAGRAVPEVVVGSTIDPPQEAALLELGSGIDGKLWFRLRTVPAVRREGAGCGASPPSEHCAPDQGDGMCGAPPDGAGSPITGAQCDATIQQLAARDECEELVMKWIVNPELHARFPDDVKAKQETQAQALLKCLGCEGCRCGATEHVLEDPGVYAWIDLLFKDSERRKELVCLSWAASVLQHRKHNPDLPQYDPESDKKERFKQGRKVLLDSFRIGVSDKRIPGVLEVAFPTDF